MVNTCQSNILKWLDTHRLDTPPNPLNSRADARQRYHADANTVPFDPDVKGPSSQADVIGGRLAAPWFRIYHAERWVEQALPLRGDRIAIGAKH